MKSLKLTVLEADALSDKAMSKVMGGITNAWCYCACAWVGQGGSSIGNNNSANSNKGLSSTTTDSTTN